MQSSKLLVSKCPGNQLANSIAGRQPTIDENLLLAWGATYQRVRKGEYIFRESSLCRYFHQLTEGSVRWVNIDEKGRECLQSLIVPGESFGEIPLFDDGPYVASAIANEASVVIRLPKDRFLEMLHTNTSVHAAIDRKMSERLRFKFIMLKTLAHQSPEVRIKQLFDFMKTEQKYICPRYHYITLTRQQIADLSGLRVETVIRAIRRMHDEGQLLVENRKIYYA
jgi:CRP-like cAMP-binding protein